MRIRHQVSRISTGKINISSFWWTFWRPKAVNRAVPTQWTTYESECLTCLHCQLLPRGNSGWRILPFLPVTHQKDNSSFLRSAHNSWKAPLLNHFLALPLTAVLCHTFTGLVLWLDMSLFFFMWDCQEKQTLIFSISSVPSLCLTFIFLGSVVVLLSPPGSKALQVDCWLSPRSVVAPVQLNDTHLPHPWLSSPSLRLPS